MPLFEYKCNRCGEVEEHFFHTLAASDVRQRCSMCRADMRKMPSRISFTPFTPFYTNHIHPEGKGIFVSGRSHLRELQRKYNVRESSLNHNQYGGDVRSIPLSVKPGGMGDNPKRRSEVGHLTQDQANKLAAEAKRTSFGTKRV